VGERGILGPKITETRIKEIKGQCRGKYKTVALEGSCFS
jgi:hypothetical protein